MTTAMGVEAGRRVMRPSLVARSRTCQADIRDALTKLVLFSCPPSAGLEALAASVTESVC